MNSKKMFTLGLILANFGLFAQNFPGKDVELLVGKEIKVLPKAESLQEYGYMGFYKDSNLKKKYACCQGFNSKYQELENKIFKVLSYESYTNIIGKKEFKLQIENDETGILYFDYSSEYEKSFPFEVIGGLVFPKEFLCKYIEEIKDKFTEKITYKTPFSEPISFIRVKDKQQINTFMSITVFGSTVSVGKTGVIILFDNGKKIEKPDAEIDTKVSISGKGYDYSAFLSLSEEEIELLKNYIISDVRLYVYDSNIKNGIKLKEYLKCISEK
jgi:hypothetical protein